MIAFVQPRHIRVDLHFGKIMAFRKFNQWFPNWFPATIALDLDTA